MSKYTEKQVKQMQDDMLKVAKENGHSMTKWRVSQYSGDYICHAYCKSCHDNIIIDTRSESVMLGAAVEQECEPGKIPF